jgi:hypothetical protein
MLPALTHWPTVPVTKVKYEGLCFSRQPVKRGSMGQKARPDPEQPTTLELRWPRWSGASGGTLDACVRRSDSAVFLGSFCQSGHENICDFAGQVGPGRILKIDHTGELQ